jgi:DNA polymerase-3 subunit beta
MKFTCNSTEILKRLSVVEKAISSRSSLPVLENVFFELNGNQLVLRGHDLELGIETAMDVQGVQNGQVLIKAKTLLSIVSKFQNQNLTIESQGQNIKISSDSQVDFNILGFATDDYPAFPSIEQGISVSLTAEEVRCLIQYTLFAVSTDETKHFLNGILVKSEGANLLFVSTDGYRLSLRRHHVQSELAAFSVIVPQKAMSEALKVLQQVKDDDVFEMTISENQVSFRLNDILFISRVIQGQFPDYNQVLPKETLHSFSVSRRALLDASERASIISSASNNVVRLGFTDSQLGIYANAAIGEFKEFINVSRFTGEGEMKVAFNVKLILDSLRHLQADDLKISFNNELGPCVIRPVSDEDYTYIIMPIRTSDYQVSRETEAVAAHV